MPTNQNLFDSLYGNGYFDEGPDGQWRTAPSPPRTGGNQVTSVETKTPNGPPTSSANSAGQNWTDFASILGSFSQGEKANRVVKGNYTQDYDQMQLNREGAINALMSGRDLDMNKLKLLAQEDRRTNEEDAMRKLQQTSYIMGGGSKFAPATISLGGKQVTLPSFSGIAPHAPSEADIAGATTLQGQMLDRLKPEGSFSPKYDFNPTWDYKVHPLEDYTEPGKLERIGSYGGVAAGALGLADNLTGGKVGGFLGGLIGKIPGLGGSAPKALAGINGMSAPNIASQGISSGGVAGAGGVMSGMLGKALPIAGIAAGGYGLTKDRGLGGNMMNGATAGAGVGSLIMPGVGTAIGAGIGAGVGALRGLGGGPSDAEKQGRVSGAQGIQALNSQATPEQKAAVGNNPDALAHVVMRDHLMAAGNPNADALAGQLLASIKEAERKGPEAVQMALANIAKTFGV